MAVNSQVSVLTSDHGVGQSRTLARLRTYIQRVLKLIEPDFHRPEIQGKRRMWRLIDVARIIMLARSNVVESSNSQISSLGLSRANQLHNRSEHGINIIDQAISPNSNAPLHLVQYTVRNA